MIWLCWLRVSPLPGCKQVPESGSDALECAVSAEHPDRIRALLDAALRSHRLGVRELEACIAFEAGDWTDDTDPGSRVREAVAAVGRSGGVQFASFGCPPPDSGAA